MHRTLLVTLLLLCAPAAAADDVPAKVLRVGVIQSLTGIAAEDGRTVVEAVELSASELNEHGRKVQLLIEDDRSTPRDALSAYAKLRNDGVQAIIGATWDFTTNPLLPLAGEDGIVMFNTSTLPECLVLPAARGFAFSDSLPAAEDAMPFEKFLAHNEAKRLVILYVSNPWGETQRTVYRDLAAKHQATVVGEFTSTAWDNNDWRNIMPRIKTAKPDAVVLLINMNDVESFLNRAAEIRLGARYFATKNAFHIFQTSRNKQLFDGLCLSYPYEQLKKEDRFILAYKNRYGREPRVYADSSYDALRILYAAFETSQAQNISLKDALLKTSVSSVAGDYSYSPQRSFASGRSSLICIEGGNIELKL